MIFHYKLVSNKKCIETLKNKLETLKQEKEGVDGKLAGLLTASKDLDNLIESQRSDKNKEGLGYTVVPPITQIYSSPKKDLSWTGLSEFVDDTVTDYSRPAPNVESSPDDAQNRNPSVTVIEASPCTISPKPFFKFIKAAERPTTDKVETVKKPAVKYAEMYRRTTKKPNVRGNQRNWNNLKSHQLGPDFVMKKKACFNCGDFNHLAYDCRKRVKRELLDLRIKLMRVSHLNLLFTDPSDLQPLQRTSTVRSQYRAPWVPTVNRNFPPVNRKLPTVRRVKKLKKKHRSRTYKLKRLYKVGLTARVISSSNDKALDNVDTSKQRRIDEIDADEDIALVSTHDDELQDEGIEDVEEEEVVEVVTTVKMLIDTVVDAAQVTTTIADVPVSADETIVITALTILAESTKTNVEVTQGSKKKGVMIQEPEGTTATKTDAIQAKIDTDVQLAQRLHEEEHLQFIDAEKAKLFMEFMEKRRKFFAAKRNKEKINKPPTKAQQRSIMNTYIKNKDGWKIKSLKTKSFAKIQELFDNAMKRINTFVNFRTELVEESSKKDEAKTSQESSLKRERYELERERSKKQKVEDDKESKELTTCLEIIPDDGDDVTIDATPLSSKSLMVRILIEQMWKGSIEEILLGRLGLANGLRTSRLYGLAWLLQRLFDIAEAALVRSIPSSVCLNRRYDLVFRKKNDNVVMIIYDFMTIPSFEDAKVVKEPHGFDYSILHLVENHTTTPVEKGTLVTEPTPDDIVASQLDHKVAKRSKALVKRKASASAKEPFGNDLSEASYCRYLKSSLEKDKGISSGYASIKSLRSGKTLGLPPPDSSNIAPFGPNCAGTYRIDAAKGARTDEIRRMSEHMDLLVEISLGHDHEHDGMPFDDDFSFPTLGEEIELKLYLVTHCPYYMLYPYVNGKSISSPSFAEIFNFVLGVKAKFDKYVVELLSTNFPFLVKVFATAGSTLPKVARFQPNKLARPVVFSSSPTTSSLLARHLVGPPLQRTPNLKNLRMMMLILKLELPLCSRQLGVCNL
nr:ubiquitin hydrolase [Tanacetum cinerariifolium]